MRGGEVSKFNASSKVIELSVTLEGLGLESDGMEAESEKARKGETSTRKRESGKKSNRKRQESTHTC